MNDINDEIIEVIMDQWINDESERLKMDKDDSYNYEGIPVPRVTRVISACNLDSNGLMKWSNSLGFKHINYTTYMNEVTRLGTAIHNAVEGYLLENKEPEFNGLETENAKNAIMNAFIGFKTFWAAYSYSNNVKDIHIEEHIVTPYFGGTADLLVEHKNGEYTLFDFKSSNKLHAHHFIQLAAYKYAFGLQGKNITKIGILLLNKYKPECTNYTLDMSIDINRIYADDCLRCFFSMLYAYYNISHIEQGFRNIILPR